MDDRELEREFVAHADLADLIHTLESYDGGGKYSRTAYDSLRAIRALRIQRDEAIKERDELRRRIEHANQQHPHGDGTGR